MIAQARYFWPGVVLSVVLASHAFASTRDSITHPRAAGKHEAGKIAAERGGSPKAVIESERPHRGGGAKTIISKASLAKGGAGKLAVASSRRSRVRLASLRGSAAATRSGAYASMAQEKRDGADDYVGAYEPAADGHQVGIASWYGGKRWNGHRTSDGGRFSDTELTAAHATLPLGSLVRVTLASSARSVVVRINDRPGTRRRIIDLSRAAAAELGILGAGTAVVTLSPL